MFVNYAPLHLKPKITNTFGQKGRPFGKCCLMVQAIIGKIILVKVIKISTKTWLIRKVIYLC